MKPAAKIAILAVAAAAIVVVIAVKFGPKAGRGGPAAPGDAGLPRLLEIGSTTSVPCKMMAPILAELRKEQAGRLRVDFIDVHKDKSAADKYNVFVIPTQVFFDAAGREVFRHEGFIAKKDILAKWKELGVGLSPAAAAPGAGAPEAAEAMEQFFTALTRMLELPDASGRSG